MLPQLTKEGLGFRDLSEERLRALFYPARNRGAGNGDGTKSKASRGG